MAGTIAQLRIGREGDQWRPAPVPGAPCSVGTSAGPVVGPRAAVSMLLARCQPERARQLLSEERGRRADLVVEALVLRVRVQRIRRRSEQREPREHEGGEGENESEAERHRRKW